MLARATGRPTERDHRLRHCCGAEGILHVCLSAADKRLLSWIVPLSPAREQAGVPFPRDLHAQSHVLGQSTPVTTIRSYFHMPWALRSRADEWIATRWLDHRTAASALGITVSGTDRITQRHKQKPSAEAWLDSVLAPRRAIEASQAAAKNEDAGTSELTAAEVGEILGWTSRLRRLDDVGRSLGTSQADTAAIRAAGTEYAAKVGRSFLPVAASPRNKAAAKRTRPLKGAEHLLKLLEIADGDRKCEQRRNLMMIVDAHFAWAKSVNSSEIILPTPEATMLVRLLSKIGQAEKYALTTPCRQPHLVSIKLLDPAGGKYGLSRELKRLLGVIWVAQRAAQRHA